MNIIIAGDGKVGSTLTRLLSAEGHNITLIDTNARVLEKSQEQFDVMGVHGNCAAMIHCFRPVSGIRNCSSPPPVRTK